jgi:hypothetical protein
MTLCIAANTYRDFGEPRIILCCDWMVGHEYHASDTLFKCDLQFGSGLCALFCGETDNDVPDLLRIYHQRLGTREIALMDIKEELWMGMREFKEWRSRHNASKVNVELLVCGFWRVAFRL